MSIDFSHLWNRNTGLSQTAAGQVTRTDSATSSTSSVNTNQNLNLSPGTTINGQVVKTDGDVATIKLSDNTTIEAKVESGANLKENTNVYFEVNSVSSNGQVVLRSLFQNTAMGQTAQNALIQAGITPNANSLGMVSAMMENGMPIDKQSLLAMYRQVSAHPEMGGANLVAMNRLELPLTDTNIQQFQAYLNLEHQISEGVEQIVDSTISLMDELASQKDASNMLNIADKLMEVFVSGMDDEKLAEFMQKTETGEINGEQATKTEINELTGQVASEANGLIEASSENGKDIAKLLADAFSSYNDNVNELAEGNKSVEQVGLQIEIANDGENVNFNNPKLQSVLKELGVNEEMIKEFSNSDNPEKLLLDLTKSLVSRAITTQDKELSATLKKLLSNEEFGQALKNQISKQWLLEPDKVADKKEVESFYENLREQTGKLTQSLSDFLPKDNALLAQINNMHDNVDFMHQLNQTMSYIQLPLKLAGDNAHGDLYVYTNKKNFAKDDGNVSAFLRLDMEHLGPVDVYIAMQNQNVSTNFYLRDDEIIDLISDNIHLLNERLEKQGYHMNATITQKETSSNVMQEIIEDHKDNMLIGTKSFDVRA